MSTEDFLNDQEKHSLPPQLNAYIHEQTTAARSVIAQEARLDRRRIIPTFRDDQGRKVDIIRISEINDARKLGESLDDALARKGIQSVGPKDPLEEKAKVARIELEHLQRI